MKKFPELKDLRYIAKKTISKSTLKKIKKIKDKSEQVRLYQYSIKSALEIKYAELKDKIEKKDKEKGGQFIPKTKVLLLGYKIHYLVVTFNRKDFKVVNSMFKKIEKEIKK